MDPNMVVVAYSGEHNHPTPASRINHHTTNNRRKSARSGAAPNVTTSTSAEEKEEEEEEEEEKKKKPVNLSPESREVILEDKFSNVYGGPLSYGDEFGWLDDFESTSSCSILDDEMAMIFKVREEDEPLFADLGELPECSTVFRRWRGGETAVLHG